MAVEVTVWAPVFVSYNDIQNEKAQSSKPASPSSPTRPPPPPPPHPQGAAYTQRWLTSLSVHTPVLKMCQCFFALALVTKSDRCLRVPNSMSFFL